MDIALQGASKPEELSQLEDPRSHYAYPEIFEAKGWGARRRNRDRLKLLQNLDATLSDLLHDGERVRCAAWGTKYSLLEEYFLGIWSWYMNHRALLVTDERILLLHIDRSKRPLMLKSQLRFGAIQKLRLAWTGIVAITPKQGAKLHLARVPKAMRKGFVAAIETRHNAAHVSNAVTHEHLCPHCFEPIVELVPACPKCRGTFKSPARARLLSLLFPGLGDLYLGHRWLGMVQLLSALFAWLVILAAAFGETEEAGDGAIGAAILLGMMLVFGHGMDAAVTGFTAKKGLYPDRRGGDSAASAR